MRLSNTSQVNQLVGGGRHDLAVGRAVSGGTPLQMAFDFWPQDVARVLDLQQEIASMLEEAEDDPRAFGSKGAASLRGAFSRMAMVRSYVGLSRLQANSIHFLSGVPVRSRGLLGDADAPWSALLGAVPSFLPVIFFRFLSCVARTRICNI